MANKSRLTFFALAAGWLLILATSAGALDIFPTVVLDSYNPVTFTYVYKVVSPVNATHPFGQLQLDAQTSVPWTLKGPSVSNQDQNWFADWFAREPAKDSLFWRATHTQEVPAATLWEGLFTVIAPGTIPVAGFALTKDGVQNSTNIFPIQVPGLVPEPSSLLALGMGAAGMLALRRKKS